MRHYYCSPLRFCIIFIIKVSRWSSLITLVFKAINPLFPTGRVVHWWQLDTTKVRRSPITLLAPAHRYWASRVRVWAGTEQPHPYSKSKAVTVPHGCEVRVCQRYWLGQLQLSRCRREWQAMASRPALYPVVARNQWASTSSLNPVTRR